ncbi:hypothetical protein GGR53DRAFT_488981 [Hypoxylon sp. FL1150]|nr:hypothetical protein GGR53DRAFT_488981 [Hypoxylon sp. FL1150]
MPFLHYETDERRHKLSSAIKDVRNGRHVTNSQSRDSLIVNAYLKSNPPLHPRRTLDQFFYHGIDTSARDTDQVVYRYCKENNDEPKVFMVDQLWLWIIGKDLIITSFPQRWDQPKQDPMNVLDGIIEETNAKTRPPIGSVYDLAMLITSQCSGMFDRHRLHDQRFQFLDMFDQSIGVVTDRESQLFRRFNQASSRSAQWLQNHRYRRGMGRPVRLPAFGTPETLEGAGMDQFPDALLDIGVETTLLAEIKDIRDELNIIGVILDAQIATLEDFEDQLADELRGDGPKHSNNVAVVEIRKRGREQLRGLEVRQKDILRMDNQAQSLYMNLTDLLDLKQKHSNALEARFAGDQAVIAAKQGQTIMVFTIVTIIFLPMSFIAAFFAINLQEWADGRLTIAYVSKYMFGIGLGISIPLIAMAFAVTDLSDAARELMTGRWLSKWKSRGHGSSNYNNNNNSYKYTGESDTLGKETTSQVIPMKTSMSTHRRSGVSRDRQVDGLLPPRIRPIYSQERSDDHYAAARLSPVSAHRGSGAGGGGGGPHKISFGSANATAWARPSLDRNRGRRLSEDLEKGRRRPYA